MAVKHQDLITQAYAAFNRRSIDAVLSTFHPDVQWSNGWEGGYVHGHEAVKNYWLRQWQEIDPSVEPKGFSERGDDGLEVAVHQVVKDLQGNVLFDGMVQHRYTFQNGLIKQMDIEK